LLHAEYLAEENQEPSVVLSLSTNRQLVFHRDEYNLFIVMEHIPEKSVSNGKNAQY